MANTTNEAYWHNEADRCYHDATILLKHNGSREAVLEKLHGAVERDLKAVLARQGKLSEAQKHHQLTRLAENAGVMQTLSKSQQETLHKTSNIHNITSYPEEYMLARPWYDEDVFKKLAIGLVHLHQLLRDWPSEGDSNGGDSIE